MTMQDLKQTPADDKGQVFMHIKAVEAHLKKNGSLPLNIKFFISHCKSPLR